MSTPPSPTRKRKRSRKACIPCHERKRKCDNEYPCALCTIYDYTCSYPENRSICARRPPIGKRVIFDGGSSTTTSTTTQGTTTDSASPSTFTTKGSAPAPVGTGTGTGSGASAAMAFPHILGLALGSDSPPKVNSFAYNFGIRPEEASINTPGFLGNLISEHDLAFYSNVYFSAIGAIGDLIDPRIYGQRCREYYHRHTIGTAPSGRSNTTNAAFAAVAAGIAAFDSYLAPPSSRSPRESDLVQYAKTVLDDPASTRRPVIDHIVAWGMRIFYLRATTRPSTAWIASCTVMHICEIVGLNEDENIRRIAARPGSAELGNDADRLRRVFWICWAGHVILSYEYDRSAVLFGALTTGPIRPAPGSVADEFAALAQLLPSPNSPFQVQSQHSSHSQTSSHSHGQSAPLAPEEDLFARLKALHTHHPTHPFLIAAKADLAFCFYRRIYQLKTAIPDSIVELIIAAGNDAVDAAMNLASQGRLLWNSIGSVFQYTCVLIAIDTPAAAANIPGAFKRLEDLVRAADTGITRQALEIARYLLSLRVRKKRRELAVLEGVEAGFQGFPGVSETETETEIDVNNSINVSTGANSGLSDGGIGFGWGMDWDQFVFEPYFAMLGAEVQVQM